MSTEEWTGVYPRPMGGHTAHIVGRSSPVGAKRRKRRHSKRSRKAGGKVGKSKNYGGLRLSPHKF